MDSKSKTSWLELEIATNSELDRQRVGERDTRASKRERERLKHTF